MDDKNYLLSIFGAPTFENPVVSATEIGRRVREARVRSRLTGTELGVAAGLGKDQISKIERGRRRVTPREFVLLAEALGVRIVDLLGAPRQPKLALAHRLTADASAAQSMTDRAAQLIEVEEALAGRAPAPAPTVSRAGAAVFAYARAEFSKRPRNAAEARRQGRDLAEHTRTLLTMGSNEIGDLAGLIERTFGVDVALSPLGTDADALCVHTDGVALIVASSDFPAGRVRFALAHALGHHILGDPGDVIAESATGMYRSGDLTEIRVNAFATHLLMPAQGVRDNLLAPGAPLEARDVVAQMERFGVPLAAALHQLVELKLMPAKTAGELRADNVEAELVERHRDVAFTAAAVRINAVVRAPERLLRAARVAAQNELMGLRPVAVLLGRDDDDALWEEVMGHDRSPATVLDL